MKYKVVVFDLDGTLMDTSEGVISSVKYAIEKMGYEVPTEEKMRTCIGPPIGITFGNWFGLEGQARKDAVDLFREHYASVDLLKAVPYEGILELFQSIRDCGSMPAVATYKKEDYAVKLLKHYGFDKNTDILYGSDPEGILTKKDIILRAINDAGVTDLSEAVMIGDSDNDAIGAKELGVDFIGVTFGFGFSDKASVRAFENIAAVDSVKELKEVLGC